jgi:hypothetical protein
MRRRRREADLYDPGGKHQFFSPLNGVFGELCQLNPPAAIADLHELDRIEIHVVRYRQTHPVEDILPDALDAGPDLSPQITARPREGATRNASWSTLI